MATYKAEFLSHYYDGRLRPLSAYAMGLIFRWARAAAWAPGAVNLVGRLPVLGRAFKAAAGIAPARRLPAFAPQTFQAWWRTRQASRIRKDVAADGSGAARAPSSRVVLWPDTFTNYFHPRVGRAAVEVLERLGYEVVVPPGTVCCGRPLYDYGMLDRAKAQLRACLETLRPYIREGSAVVGLEPSCVAVFRDEMGNLFPDDQDARRLCGRAFVLSEFLLREHQQKALPRLSGHALLHVHCHEKALVHGDPERELLQALGLTVETPDPGCCGMAGSFGFEHGHYDLSMKIGDRTLLPAVRGAAPDTTIVADGFSCRTQIEQGSPRRALHVAEVLRLAYERRGEEAPRLPAYAERRLPSDAAAVPGWAPAVAAALALSGWIVGRRLARRDRGGQTASGGVR
jgi:Fe-S oxidoreductase